MKITDKKKAVKTIPDGVWESSRPASDKNKSDSTAQSTDIHGNGYPKKQSR